MYWLHVIMFTVIFCVTTAGSIVLLGDRALISGNLFSVEKIISILLNWKFMLAIVLAIGARLSFVLINNNLLKIPRMADNSTTATVFITTIGYAAVMLTNYWFLGEKFTSFQLLGCVIIMIGIVFIVK